MQEIMAKYENPKQVDKIAMVNSNLEDVRSSVRSSVRKILTNQVELEDLEQKSMTLRGTNNTTQTMRASLVRVPTSSKGLCTGAIAKSRSPSSWL